MNLETYLNNVEGAKKEEITSNFGIYDNWIMWLNENINDVNKWMEFSNKFIFNGLSQTDNVYGTTTSYDYYNGVVLVRVVSQKKIEDSFLDLIERIKGDMMCEGIAHITDKLSNAKTLILLDSCQENQNNVKTIYDQVKVMAEVNDIICREFAFNQGVSLYLPHATYK